MILTSDVLTLKDEIVDNAIKAARKSNKEIDKLISNIHPTFNGERFLTDYEVSKILHISRRTMQKYRSNFILPYYKLGGRVIYKESDVEALFERNYRKPLPFL